MVPRHGTDHGILLASDAGQTVEFVFGAGDVMPRLVLPGGGMEMAASAAGGEGQHAEQEEGAGDLTAAGDTRRRRECHFADVVSPCLLKRLLGGEGVVAE